MTTVQETTRDIVQKAYDGMTSGDIEGFLGQLADDVVLVEPDGGPVGGTYSGRDNLGKAFASIAAGLGLQGMTLNRLIVQDDRAVGFVDVVCASPSGETITMALLESWLVRDGQVVEIRPFWWDTAALAAHTKG